MVHALTIADSSSTVVIVPELGAGLASFDLLVDEGQEPLFRPCRDLARAQPFDLASNLLVPWSGRISGGGFRFGDRFHSLDPNLAGEPLPIHGSGFASSWTVVEAAGSQAILTLSSSGPGPYRFDARVIYTLDAGALIVSLAVTSHAADPLPYGLGLHPWLPRTPGTTVRAKATTVTLEDSRHLPAGQVPVASRKDWDFSEPRRLPGAWINNDFSGWDGRAEIVWEDRNLRLVVDTDRDPSLTTFILYSPASDADFFCFEPVTHPVDAHNRPGGPEANGLCLLAPGDTLAVSCRFSPSRLS